MKNKFFIVLMTVVVTALCLFYLSFTFISRGVSRNAEQYATEGNSINAEKKQLYLDSLWNKPVYNLLGAEFTLKEVKQNELKLGLDLQGGMHMVLEIAPESIIKNLATNPENSQLNEALKKAGAQNDPGLFVSNFIRHFNAISPDRSVAELFATPALRDDINVSSSDNEVQKLLEGKIDGAIDRSFNILRDRIDRFGVANPNIQLLPGTGRIQIELPGVEDPERVRKLVQGIARLEFYEVYDLSDLNTFIISANEVWMKTNETAVVQESTSLLEDLGNDLSTDSVKTAKQDSLPTKMSPFLEKLVSNQGLVYEVRDTAVINDFLNNPEVQKMTPSKLRFHWAVKHDVDTDGKEFIELYPLKLSVGSKAVLDGEVINDSRQDLDEKGSPAVSMQMNPYGAKLWHKITSKNIGNQIAIVLDGFVYSAPFVQSEIPNGNSSISGNFTIEEAKDLANILEAGKLPASTNIVEEAVVGPSLGQEAVIQGLLSMVAGLGMVIIFMLIYYNTSGLIANLALFLNVFFILGILVQFGAALTLPGIAGIVLTIGMSVDANVLIFERIKEELKNGQSFKAAVSTGYSKAYSSIVDSNVTTFLTGAILYIFGSGGVKGFAVVLMIGIACSLFTAVFITRLIIEWRLNGKRSHMIKFTTPFSSKWFPQINYDFVGKRKLAYFFSAAVFTLGLIAMIIKGGIPLGIDFKGGRSYIVQFENAVPVNEVRASMEQVFPDASLEVKTFNGDHQLKITTSYLIQEEGKNADKEVTAALTQGLKQVSPDGFKVLSSSKIGPTVADDLKADSQTSVLYSLLVIFAYIVLRFQRWQYGLGAIIALFHDVLMVVSFFALANLFGLHLEIDQVFIAAVLTVIGYSINDTVVVFDRIREFSNRGTDLPKMFNTAINNTLSRTTITSLTVFIVVVVLLIFGGDILRGFSFALLIGVIFGTYSSIFIAAPVVLDMDRKRSIQKEPVKMNPKKSLAA